MVLHSVAGLIYGSYKLESGMVTAVQGQETWLGAGVEKEREREIEL